MVMIPGAPDYRPHLRCQQCRRFLPTDDAVAHLITDVGNSSLCAECYAMQQRVLAQGTDTPS